MSMMGKMSFFLGLQISQSPRGIFINQSNYALEIIKKYGMLFCDPVDTPMVDKSKLNEDLQGQSLPKSTYMQLSKSFDKGTIDMGLWYSKDSCITLTAYADAYHARCQDTRRNTSGSTQFLGDKLVSWSSKNQKSTAISTTEAEYIALSRSKWKIEWWNSISSEQKADIFTKALPQERFNFLIEMLGMKSMSPETLNRLAEEEEEIIKQDKAQQVARNEKLVPSNERVKIGKSNLRMDPSVTQREETYQVVLDIINNTLCYNAFLISIDVPKIYMQQFWFTIRKVKKSSFCQFDIDNKTCQIDVEIFQEILDICPPNKVFTVPPSSSDSLIEFLLELG
ncbi:hypothetical protein Tco_1337711 [Tanacetum coccineum]